MDDCICMYAPSADGGMAQYASEVMTALARHRPARHRFELVTEQGLDPGFHSDDYAIHPILPSILHRSAFSTRLTWAANRIGHYARRERCFLRWLRKRPDVTAVHLQEWTPWLAAPVLRRIRKMGKRVYYTVHNVVPHRYPALVPKALMNRWIRRGCRLCDGLFVHTESLARTLSDFLGRPHPPIHVAPHGVWTVGDDAPRPSLEQRLKLNRLLFFGTIRRNKGLDLLLRAADHLPSGCAITIAGEPQDRDFLQTEIRPAIDALRRQGKTIDLHDRFIPEAELPALFARHSAIVLPYTSGFVAQSGVAFLALAYDVPLVVSEVGGLRDLLAEFRIGVTFADGSPEALAAAVRELFAGDAARTVPDEIRAAKERLTWQATAAATIAGYDAAPLEQSTEVHDWTAQTTLAR
jgi:glycosyltransferase involved in cell wall biosynthesis